jgi:quinol monooxygenase YgiN
MISVVAKIKAKAGQEEELKKIVTDTMTKVEDEEGTLVYRFHQNAGDPTEFLFFEVYKDQESLGVHGQTDYFKAMGNAMKDMLDGAPEFGMYTEVARIKE